MADALLTTLAFLLRVVGVFFLARFSLVTYFFICIFGLLLPIAMRHEFLKILSSALIRLFDWINFIHPLIDLLQCFIRLSTVFLTFICSDLAELYLKFRLFDRTILLACLDTLNPSI
jgi:hypothetical protein